jgi:parallel beta-helix repeat protein
MNRTASLIIIAFTITAFLAVFQPTTAQNNILIVPDEFPTINQAIQNATDGDNIFIKEGIYNETLVIDKQLNIQGEDTNKTIINGNLTGTVIQIFHDNVNITGLTVTYSLTANVPRRYFQHNIPDGWMKLNGWCAIGYPLDGGYFDMLRNFRLGGIHVINATNCFISGNRIIDCGIGIWLWEASKNTISGNVCERNDYGIELRSSADNQITRNTFINNAAGAWLPLYADIYYMVGWGNDEKTHDNTFSQNNFIGNQKAIETQSLTNTKNYWDNGSIGNYWDTSNGNDTNNDGLGDDPYKIKAEYYTGGYLRNGTWKEQTNGIDHYPLMAPFNTTETFTIKEETPTPEEQTKPNAPDYTLIEIAASVLGIFAIVGLVAYFLSHRDVFDRTT